MFKVPSDPLLSHNMKGFERTLGNQIREIVEIAVNQAGFVKNCGSIDPMHAAQLLMEKNPEKHRPLNTTFLGTIALPRPEK